MSAPDSRMKAIVAAPARPARRCAAGPLWAAVPGPPAGRVRAARLLWVAALALCLGGLLASVPACAAGEQVPAQPGFWSSMMARLPRECAAGGCVFLDTAAMQEHLQGLYATYRESFAALGDYGVRFDDVDRLASAGLSLFVLEGRFDRGRIREELGIRDYGRAAYLGVEVWQRDEGDYAEWVALPQGLVVAGCRDSVIDCLEVIIDDEDSLRRHPDVAGVAERLPGGLDMSVAAMGLANPLLAHGESLQTIDGQACRLTVVRKYSDAGAAESAAPAIAPDMQNMLSPGLRAVEVRREGQFLTLTAEVAPDVICARMTAD